MINTSGAFSQETMEAKQNEEKNNLIVAKIEKRTNTIQIMFLTSHFSKVTLK